MVKDCEYCKTKFYCKPSRHKKGEGRYCSARCYFLKTTGNEPGYPKKKNCVHCGTEFIVRDYNRRRKKYCSSSCAATVNNKLRKGRVYGKAAPFRLKLLKIFGHLCTVCKYTTFVDAHHITPRKDNGSDDVSNGIILCPNHHKEADKGIIPSEELFEINKKFREAQPLVK